MLPILVLGIQRPALAAALAERGLVARAVAPGAAAALVREDAPRPVCPAVVETFSEGRASALLDGGADDVVLASDPDSLVAARLAALIRRSTPGQIAIGDLTIDTHARRVTRGDEVLPLLPREYALLVYLARHVGTLVSATVLHRALWDRAFHPGTNVIAVHVSRLRAKLGEGGVTVRTERGKGYRLVVPVAAGGPGR